MPFIVQQFLRFIHKSRFIIPVLVATVVGVITGLAAVIFIWLIHQFQYFFSVGGEKIFSWLGSGWPVLVPVAGALLVALIIRFWSEEAKGDGIPEVLSSLVLKKGRISYRTAAAKLLASSIAIGSGASVGREGPIVQIGSSLGSYIARWLKFSESRVRALIAGGAAGGIAASFNTPIAGVMFAMEVVLRDFAAPILGGVVISAVAASIVCHTLLGQETAFFIPDYIMIHPVEILFYALLGLLTAFLAQALMRAIDASEGLFEKIAMPLWVKLALGGLLVGLLGLVCPQILGSGHEMVGDILLGKTALKLLFIMMLGKILATSISMGSGTSGGAFTPALFIGAAGGGLFGGLVHLLFPSVTGAPGGYALVGMAACFAGIAHAPITAIMIVFEMTDGYHMILPLMIASVISASVSQILRRDSVYTHKLHQKGIEVDALRPFNLTDSILVEEVMSRDVPNIPRGMKVHEVLQLFAKAGREAFAVEDEEGDLSGIVTLREAQEAAIAGDTGLILVEDIAHIKPVVCYSDETLNEALKFMGDSDINQLPVVERAFPKHIVGMLTRADIVRGYSRVASHHDKLLNRIERHKTQDPKIKYLEFFIKKDTAIKNQAVKDLGLPEGCTLISITRNGRTIVPRGDTVFEVKDIGKSKKN